MNHNPLLEGPAARDLVVYELKALAHWPQLGDERVIVSVPSAG